MEFFGNPLDYEASRPSYPGHLVSYLSPNKLSNVVCLDIGCGTGKLSRLMGQQKWRVVGIDTSLDMVRQAQNCSTAEEYLNVSFENFQAEFKFDLITCAQSWHWIEQNEGFKKIDSLLSDDGLFAIVQIIYPPDSSLFRERLHQIYFDILPTLSKNPNSNSVHLSMLDKMKLVIKSSELSYNIDEHIIDSPEFYTFERYKKLLSTYSDHQNIPGQQKSNLLSRIKSLFDDLGGTVQIGFKTQLILIKRF